MKLELNTTSSKYSDVLKMNAYPCMPLIVETEGVKGDPEHIWDSTLIEFIDSMLGFLKSTPSAIALSSNQLWNPTLGLDTLPSVFVMKVSNTEIQEFINPMVKGTGRSLKEAEGCMSFNKKSKQKRRHKNALVIFNTLSHIDEQAAIKFSGNLSRAVQHEIDHLRGKTLFKFKPKEE